MFAVILLWCISLLATPFIVLWVILSIVSFYVFIRTMRIHDVAAQCEMDNDDMYEFLFGLKKCRDRLTAENSALARMITRQKLPNQAGTLSKRRRNSYANDLRECIASRILSQSS